MSETSDIGRPAPPFDLTDQAGKRHRLADYRGQPLVLYFYPKDSTPGCTKEACDFRDASKSLAQQGAAVLGVSPDDEASHARFAQKQSLNFPLLADTDQKACEAYGVWQEKSMYGKKFMGVVRSTFLIDPQGNLAAAWRKVKVPGHVEAVLAAVDDLPKSD
jgi:peroxiredoxin Q/BCP